jgi:hypothetical protein
MYLFPVSTGHGHFSRLYRPSTCFLSLQVAHSFPVSTGHELISCLYRSRTCVSRLYRLRTCMHGAGAEGGGSRRQQHCAAPKLQAVIQHVHPHTAPYHHPPPAPFGVVVPSEGGSLTWVQNGGRFAGGRWGGRGGEERHDTRVRERASHDGPRAAATQHRDGSRLDWSDTERRLAARRAAQALTPSTHTHTCQEVCSATKYCTDQPTLQYLC